MTPTTSTAPRWVDPAGDAWPITGRWCATCSLPLLPAEPGQAAHPNCEDLPFTHGDWWAPHEVEDRAWCICGPGRTCRWHRAQAASGSTSPRKPDSPDVEDHEEGAA